ncbi:lonely Cys domain-containing protein [Streptomyces sp. RTd22]|uniref:lonely Cys domain-containing protein n=1 Tax=Streptomyces sp. RTd22 TaxID=1841249 RepID=UPI0007D90EED|nr:lonely Cys domain-containing protein [Streptomyces sp. RTd22]
MRPDTAPSTAPANGPDPLAPPDIGDEPAAVNVLTGEDSPLGKSNDITGVFDSWRAITLPDGTQGPFIPPRNGFHVRNIIGAESILAASTIALARAHDNRLATTSGLLTGDALERALRTARITPLTAEGTGSAQVLEESHGSGALSAFFEHASSNDGYETAGLTENGVADRSEGALRVFSRPDFAGAQLMAVADGARMESSVRVTQSNNATASQGGDHNTVFGAAPALKSDSVGAANPGASGTGADTSDSDGRVIANDQARQVNVKPSTGRVFAFAIPTAWLSVADVHRQFKELPASKWIRKHLLGSLGGVRPGRQTVESQTHVMAWVREDVARQLGLITDDNFPETVAKAWDKVKDAAKTWADEDAKYWELRRGLPDLREAAAAAMVARSVARQLRRQTEDAAGAESAAARRDLAAARAAADAALEQAPEDFPAPVADELRSAAELAAQALQSYQAALLADLTDAAPAARAESARQALTEADALVGSIRRRERDRMATEAQQAFDSRMAAAEESVASARDAAHAAAQAFRAAERAVEARIAEVRSQERKAEDAADALHHLRAQTDRLTRWHRLPEDPPSGEEGAVPTRAGLPEPQVTDWEPGKTERTENPAKHSDRPKVAKAPKLGSITEESSAEPKPVKRPRGPRSRPTPRPPGLGSIAEETPEELSEGETSGPDTSDPETTGVDTGDTRDTGKDTGDTGKDRREDSQDDTFREEPETSGTPPRYTEVTALGDGAPALKSPEGTTHRLLDVPADNSFLRAFQRALPAARTGADGAPLHAAGLRNALADAVEGLPDDSPLLAYFSPDETDTFTSAELDAAALDLGTDTPQRREFDALGVIPHSAGDQPTPDRRYRPLSPAQRRGLAAAQLRRGADAANDTGWDHSAADLFPALAARAYGVGVRVVRDDGTYRDFSPHPDRPLPSGAERVVLYLTDRHFRAVEAAAVAEGPPPQPKPEPPVDNSLLTAHATRPWTWEGLDDETYAEQPKFDAATDVHSLTDPDGYIYDLVLPRVGDGNLFYSAIAVALGAAPAGGRGFQVIDDLIGLMDDVPLPRTARLDPRATFTDDDLYEAGFRPLTPERRREFERGGGRLPESWPPLPPWVREGLIRAHLRNSRRWSRETALLAAQLVAENRDLHVTFVHENGTIDTFGTASADADNAIVLYERGGDFLAATPRGASNPRGPWNFRTTKPAPPPPTRPAPPPPTRPAPAPPVVALPPAGPPGGKGAPKPPPARGGRKRPVNGGLPSWLETPPVGTGSRSGTESRALVRPGDLRAALERLDTLRADVPELADGPLDMDALARHVLLLDPDTPVTEAHRDELLSIALAPEMAAAPSLAVLAGFGLAERGATAVRDFGHDVDAFAARVLHLAAPDPARRRDLARLLERAANVDIDLSRSMRLATFRLATGGLFAPERVIRRHDGTAVGRDGDQRLDTLDVDLHEVTLVGVGPDGKLSFDVTDTAPWDRPKGPAPWVVRLAGPLGEGLLSGRVPAEDVAHLLHIDPERRAGSEIVLLLPRTDPATAGPAVERLLDAVTRGTGVRVYAAYGMADFFTDGDGRTTVALGPGRDGRRRTAADFVSAGPSAADKVTTRPGTGRKRIRPQAGVKRHARRFGVARPPAKRPRTGEPVTVPPAPLLLLKGPVPEGTPTKLLPEATPPKLLPEATPPKGSTPPEGTLPDGTTPPKGTPPKGTLPKGKLPKAPPRTPIMTSPVGGTTSWARGRPLPVAADGNCLLHAFVASDPLLVRDALPGPAADARSRADREAYAWLSDPARVRAELGRGRAPGRSDRHVLDAMQRFIADYLTANRERLPVEIVRQYRASVPGGLAAAVEEMDEVELVMRLTELGVPVPDQREFPSAAQLLGELRYLVVRHTPLDDRELAGLRAAVLNWSNRWNSDIGDVFPRLLAHAFDARIDIAWFHRRTDGRTGRRGMERGIGPESAVWEIELFRSNVVDANGRPVGGDHYEGSTAAPRFASTTAPVGRTTGGPSTDPGSSTGGPSTEPGPTYSGRPASGGTAPGGTASRATHRPGPGQPGQYRPGTNRSGARWGSLGRPGSGRQRHDRAVGRPSAPRFPALLTPEELAARTELNRLRKTDPELRRGPLDMTRLARRVLLLTPEERVTGDRRAELIRLASSPEARNVTSLAGLSALYLVDRGVFDDRFRVTDTQGRPRGINWTDSGIPADLDLTSTAVQVRRDGDSAVVDVRSALWASGPGRPDPYLLATSGDHQFLVRGRAGFQRQVPFEVLNELMALDPVLTALPWDGTVAVMIPGFGRTPVRSRMFAARHNRNVVATSGIPAVVELPDRPGHRVFGLMDDEGRPRGDFFMSTPGPVPPDAGADDWVRDADVFPLPDTEGRATGFVSVDVGADTDGGRDRLLHAAQLPAVTSFVTYNAQIQEYGEKRNVPWPPGSTVFTGLHGLPGTVAWPTRDGLRYKSGRDHARAVARWFSLVQPSPHRDGAQLICFSAVRPGVGGVVGYGRYDGPLPFVPDPLAVVAVGQDQATETGMTVYGPRHRISVETLADGTLAVVVHTNARGEGALLVKYRPAPKGAALDGRARTAGLHNGPGPASEAVRYQALKLVHALREVFDDPDVDDRPDYPDLLRGIGALDRMRERDPALDRDGIREFTLDLLHRAVRAFRPSRPDLRPGGPEHIQEVLARADAAWQAKPGRPLGSFVVLPHLTTALNRLPAAGTPGAEATAREVLGTEDGQPVGEAELSWLLWTEVKLLELLDTVVDGGVFAAGVLHLDRPDPARFDEAVAVVRKALAVGRASLPEVAAYHLESRGALSDRTLGKNPAGLTNGRDLVHGSAALDGDFDASVVTLMDYAPDGSLIEVGTAPAPWYAPDRPAPFPYVFDGGFLGAPVPGPEFGELVFRDRELHGAPGNADILLVADGARPPAGAPLAGSLPGEGAWNSARGVWATYGRTGIHRRPGSRTFTVYVAPDASGRRPRVSDWDLIRPRDLTPRPAWAPLAGAPAATYGIGGQAPQAVEPADTPAALPQDDGQRDDGGQAAETTALAWDEHTQARELLAEAVESAEAAAATGPDAAERAAAAERLEDALTRLEDAGTRLYDLGVPPAELAAATAPGNTAALPAPALGDELRGWLAGHVTAEDLRQGAPRLDPAEFVAADDLRAAGGELTSAQTFEAKVNGGRVQARGVSPLDQVRLLLHRSGPGPDGLDAVAAEVSRRLWRSAYEAFAAAATTREPAPPQDGTQARDAAPPTDAAAPADGAPPQDGTGPRDDGAAPDPARAWELAAFLVLPAPPHTAQADARYAGDAYHAAVRDVAEHLLDHGPDARSAAELADTRRRELGLRPRWTETTRPAPAPRPRPVSSSATAMPDQDMPDLETSDVDMFEAIEVSESSPDESVFSEGSASDSETSVYSDSSDEDAPAPAPKPASRTALPAQAEVRFAKATVGLSDAEVTKLRGLARSLALAGLRNQRAGLPLPEILITGHGNDLRSNDELLARQTAAQARGNRRARTVAMTLTYELGRALRALQRNRPGGEQLSSGHFSVVSRGLPLVPANKRVAQAPLPTRIDISTSPRGKGAETLDELRRREKRLRHGPMEVDGLARSILHLPEGAAVDQAVRDELFDLVLAADQAGRATSLSALGAFHAQRQGVLDARHRFTGAQNTGLNWAGTGSVEVDTATVELAEKNRQGGITRLGVDQAQPWEGAGPAFVVAGKGDRHKVTVPWPDGTTRDLGIEEFAELLAHDPVLSVLPKDVPIVLAVPYAGYGLRYLPRLLAHLTGRTVYAHSGDVEVVSRPGRPSSIRVTHHKGRRQGDWVPDLPGRHPGSYDDVPLWHHDVETSAIVSKQTKKLTGQSAFAPDDLADFREEYLRRIDQLRRFAHYNPATGVYSSRFVPADPDEAAPAVYQGAHGYPGGISVTMEDGDTRILDGPETQSWARAQRILMSVLPKGHWGDLEICWAGSHRDGRVPQRDHSGSGFSGPYVTDPLEDVPVGQRYANGLRRKIRCTVRISGIAHEDNPNRIYFRVLYTDPQGRRSVRAKFFPEPRTGELVRRARAIGFTGPDGKVSERDRKRTLRLVRALKLALGDEVDDAVRIEENPGYAELLRGASALDRMWHADGRFGDAGPFTMELFHRIVAAKLLPGQAEARRADYRRVLLEAANAADGTRLSDFVTLPPAVDAASAWKDGHADPARFDRAVASMLKVTAAEVKDRHRSMAFWARAKGHELLDQPGLDVDGLARKALHLAAADPVDDARRGKLWILVGKAFARGRDATDPDVLAAFHLERSAPFADLVADPALTWAVIGSDWSTGRRSRPWTPPGSRRPTASSTLRGTVRTPTATTGRCPSWCVAPTTPRTRTPYACASGPTDPSSGCRSGSSWS